MSYTTASTATNRLPVGNSACYHLPSHAGLAPHRPVRIGKMSAGTASPAEKASHRLYSSQGLSHAVAAHGEAEASRPVGYFMPVIDAKTLLADRGDKCTIFISPFKLIMASSHSDGMLFSETPKIYVIPPIRNL